MDGMNTQAPDTTTGADNRNYTPSSAVDDIAGLLVESGATEDTRDIHDTYAPRGANYDDTLEGFAQAAREIKARDRNNLDLEQSDYIPDDDDTDYQDTGVNQVNSLPYQFDTPEKITKGISWLEGEIQQLNAALQRNIISQAQYDQGTSIAQRYAQQIQGAVLGHQQQKIQAQQQEAAAHDYISQHIPSWSNPNNRQATVRQMYNFLSEKGFTQDQIQSLPHTPEMAIFVHKLMQDSHKAKQIQSKHLKNLNKQKQAKKQAQAAKAPNNTLGLADKTSAIADVLMRLGGV